MECYCDIDAPYPEMLEKRLLKRQNHPAPRLRIFPAPMLHGIIQEPRKCICDECGQPIYAGEYYYRIRGYWDGEFETYRQHYLCGLLFEKIQDCCGCAVYGDMQNQLEKDEGFSWEIKQLRRLFFHRIAAERRDLHPPRFSSRLVQNPKTPLEPEEILRRCTT
jgi:hypothetical protein